VSRVALRGIRAHLVQFLLSLLAVALGVAFVAGTFSLRTMMSSTFTGIVEGSTTGDAYVRGSEPIAPVAQDGTQLGEARNTIPASLATSIEKIDGVKHAFASNRGLQRAIPKLRSGAASQRHHRQAGERASAPWPQRDWLGLGDAEDLRSERG
jgi:predicted lysophospholipase L1 biosynthesis ABC-type transport system permease subunit